MRWVIDYVRIGVGENCTVWRLDNDKLRNRAREGIVGVVCLYRVAKLVADDARLLRHA